MAARSIASGTISFGLVSIPVRVYVATQSQQVSVPNTVGQTESAALTTLADAGLTAIVGPPQTVTTPSEDGKVQAQEPSGGKVKRGAKVTITPGQFVAPTNTTTTTTP